jgi:glycerophosphoryl diester phosphodiesterase
MLIRSLTLLFATVLSVCAEVHIVAHRGASAYAAENTISAFQLAWEQGADAIEADFRITKDGHIVCIHDADTTRVANRNLIVKNTNLGDLQALELKPFAEEADVLRIPLLSDVLGTIPSEKFAYLEIKSDVDSVAPFLESLRNSPVRSSQLVIISFNVDVLKAVAAQAPELKTMLLVSLRRKGFGLTPSFASILEKADLASVDGVSVKAHPMMPPTFGEELISKGYEFHVWTVDSADWGIEMVQRGAQSITTNRPALMRAAVESSIF